MFQTSELRRLGMKVTYSGDSPFQLRLVRGVSNEKANAFPSRIPIYVTNDTFLPTTCHPDTGRRTDVDVPFSEGIPMTSLVSMDDVRCICPDVTHMITRCVERDLKRMAQKIVDDKHPYEAEPIRAFEENLTAREAKKPVCHFTRTTPTTKPGKVSMISLSGSGALTVIADTDELQQASNPITGLYDGVWGNEIVSGTGNSMFANSVKVLKEMFPELFQKTNPLKPNDAAQYISVYDASELLRQSLNRCVVLLRDSKTTFDLVEFSHWAEAYYQTSLLLFGEKGLTPYKLKLTLFPALVRSGHIDSPWFHMCEGLEKSNHHAHKDFQTRTMRGGGFLYSQDPMFLELCFSYCKFLRLAALSSTNAELSDIQSQTSQAVYGVGLAALPSPTYRDICQRELNNPRIPVGEARESLLAGIRFFVTGSYAGTTAATKGARRNPPLKPQEMVEQWIRELGGEVYTKEAMKTMFYTYSRIPNFFIVLKDGEELNKGTMTKAELAAHIPSRCATQSTTDHDSDTSRTSTSRVKLSNAAKFCREFAGGDMTFLKVQYIVDSLVSKAVLDPYSVKYQLQPGSNVQKVTVKDVRPLLIHQTNQDQTDTHISAIVALKRHRGKSSATTTETDAQTNAQIHTDSQVDESQMDDLMNDEFGTQLLNLD